jgi:hypothetical protein
MDYQNQTGCQKSDLYGLLPLAGQTNPNGRVQFVIGKF